MPKLTPALVSMLQTLRRQEEEKLDRTARNEERKRTNVERCAPVLRTFTDNVLKPTILDLQKELSAVSLVELNLCEDSIPTEGSLISLRLTAKHAQQKECEMKFELSADDRSGQLTIYVPLPHSEQRNGQLARKPIKQVREIESTTADTIALLISRFIGENIADKSTIGWR